ncbi:cytochrome P450 [Solihabitans fulvus]|uniref:Cytochrome P450 n=1 Tax=Solihabitans fulvus TaxID=1892852 RepID=A0A5B2WST5_9PSEU|nr:cytochrome P450 [Solihabitans fulvus]KAA2253616.1 cytochrome P450 [Solihabitans fulvus]
MTATEQVLDIPFDDAFQFDPSPTWARLREHAPIVRVRTLAGAVVWLVTRHADVRMVLTDPRFSRAATVAANAPRVAVARPLAGTLPATDPPEHTRLRGLVSGAFAHRAIERTRPWVRALAERLAGDLVDAGSGADLRQLFALPLPIQVICQLLGVPYADRARFREWTELAYSMSMAEHESIDAAMASLLDYMAALVADKRAARREPADLLDELVLAQVDQDRLSDDELVAFGVNLLVAGHETSANQIGSFVATLLREPAHWARLVADRSLVPSAVEELLRFNRLSEVGQLRVATEDVSVAGTVVRAGDGVMAAIGSANRDPRAFPEPDTLDLARTPNQHLALGAGPHFCLGAQLARIELQESLHALLARFPDLRLAVPAEQLPWRRVLVSGLAELPVTFTS